MSSGVHIRSYFAKFHISFSVFVSFPALDVLFHIYLYFYVFVSDSISLAFENTKWMPLKNINQGKQNRFGVDIMV